MLSCWSLAGAAEAGAATANGAAISAATTIILKAFISIPQVFELIYFDLRQVHPMSAHRSKEIDGTARGTHR